MSLGKFAAPFIGFLALVLGTDDEDARRGESVSPPSGAPPVPTDQPGAPHMATPGGTTDRTGIVPPDRGVIERTQTATPPDVIRRDQENPDLRWYSERQADWQPVDAEHRRALEQQRALIDPSVRWHGQRLAGWPTDREISPFRRRLTPDQLTPRGAAFALARYYEGGGRDRRQIAAYQEVIGINPDGLVGADTTNSANALGVVIHGLQRREPAQIAMPQVPTPEQTLAQYGGPLEAGHPSESHPAAVAAIGHTSLNPQLTRDTASSPESQQSALNLVQLASASEQAAQTHAAAAHETNAPSALQSDANQLAQATSQVRVAAERNARRPTPSNAAQLSTATTRLRAAASQHQAAVHDTPQLNPALHQTAARVTSTTTAAEAAAADHVQATRGHTPSHTPNPAAHRTAHDLAASARASATVADQHAATARAAHAPQALQADADALARSSHVVSAAATQHAQHPTRANALRLANTTGQVSASAAHHQALVHDTPNAPEAVRDSAMRVVTNTAQTSDAANRHATVLAHTPPPTPLRTRSTTPPLTTHQTQMGTAQPVVANPPVPNAAPHITTTGTPLHPQGGPGQLAENQRAAVETSQSPGSLSSWMRTRLSMIRTAIPSAVRDASVRENIARNIMAWFLLLTDGGQHEWNNNPGFVLAPPEFLGAWFVGPHDLRLRSYDSPAVGVMDFTRHLFADNPAQELMTQAADPPTWWNTIGHNHLSADAPSRLAQYRTQVNQWIVTNDPSSRLPAERTGTADFASARPSAPPYIRTPPPVTRPRPAAPPPADMTFTAEESLAHEAQQRAAQQRSARTRSSTPQIAGIPSSPLWGIRGK